MDSCRPPAGPGYCAVKKKYNKNFWIPPLPLAICISKGRKDFLPCIVIYDVRVEVLNRTNKISQDYSPSPILPVTSCSPLCE